MALPDKFLLYFFFLSFIIIYILYISLFYLNCNLVIKIRCYSKLIKFLAFIVKIKQNADLYSEVLREKIKNKLITYKNIFGSIEIYSS